MPMFNPSHPGEVLADYLQPGLTITALSLHLGMTRANVSMILNGRAGVSASVAAKLSEAFDNTSPEFWLELQNNSDLWQITHSRREKITPIRSSLPMQKAS